MSKDRFHAIEAELNLRYLDREQEIHGLSLATLSKSHIEFLGPPGNAKSMLVRDFSEYLSADYFSWLMTKFTSPDELFGPVSIKGLKEDHYQRVTTGKLPEAQIVYLDEIYKASSAILNALLSLLQERIFHNNGAIMHCPLHFCVATSNEIPDEDEGLTALRDRFPLRYNPGYIQDKDTFLSLLSLHHGDKYVQPIESDNLSTCIAEVAALVLSDEARESIALVWERLRDENVLNSDRRYKQLVGIMAAESWMMGEDSVVADSLMVAEHVLWNKPDDIKTVKQVVRASINPSLAVANEILGAANEAMQDLEGDYVPTEEMLNVTKQLDYMIEEIAELTQSPQVAQIKQKLSDHRRRLVERMLSSGSK